MCDLQQNGLCKHVAHNRKVKWDVSLSLSEANSVLFETVKESVEDVDCH